ncbi:MAG: type II toxin-antitoxin system RelE/ParE family toxin [Spirochaetales bacterium]|nr:type II toxin-antitoxin system RelE/ParE family toxin [Spirochaetales bacterium]
MQKYSVEVSDTAQSDIKGIVSYINLELKNPLSAKKLAVKFRDSILSLEKMPKRFNLVKDEMLSRSGIRKMVIDNYLAFYIVDDNKEKVSIIRVLYSRRDWEEII